MTESPFALILASVVAQSAPIILAVIGETITERVGVINLSLNGTIMLAAMIGFAATLAARTFLEGVGIPGNTLPVLAGVVGAGLVGAGSALLVAWGSARLKQDQVAIGFVLTLLLANLANFLGQGYTGNHTLFMQQLSIPLLSQLPIIGPALFGQDLMIYAVFAVIALSWWWMYKTQPGLQLRGIGERPESAFGRGVSVNRLRYLYTGIGGALVGSAGVVYSLDIKPGWDNDRVLGYGWIALAIVIFGGWHPIRGMIGALLIGAAQPFQGLLQQNFPEIPAVLTNTFQWLLMLGVLLLVGSDGIKRLVEIAPKPLQRPLAAALRIAPPQALGRVIGED